MTNINNMIVAKAARRLVDGVILFLYFLFIVAITMRCAQAQEPLDPGFTVPVKIREMVSGKTSWADMKSEYRKMITKFYGNVEYYIIAYGFVNTYQTKKIEVDGRVISDSFVAMSRPAIIDKNYRQPHAIDEFHTSVFSAITPKIFDQKTYNEENWPGVLFIWRQNDAKSWSPNIEIGTKNSTKVSEFIPGDRYRIIHKIDVRNSIARDTISIEHLNVGSDVWRNIESPQILKIPVTVVDQDSLRKNYMLRNGVMVRPYDDLPRLNNKK